MEVVLPRAVKDLPGRSVCQERTGGIREVWFSLTKWAREIFKIILVLAHGYAHVMAQSTTVAQRILYVGVMNDDGLFKAEVNFKMMKYAKKSHYCD